MEWLFWGKSDITGMPLGPFLVTWSLFWVMVTKSYFFIKKSLKVTFLKIYVLIAHEVVEQWFINRKMKRNLKKKVINKREKWEWLWKKIMIMIVLEIRKYKAITNFLRSPLFDAELYFVANSAKVFSTFTRFFQKEEPLIHLLLPELERLSVTVVMNRIVPLVSIVPLFFSFGFLSCETLVEIK